jgi:N6-L-threonylcarbamoyladenine synthase
MKGNSHDFSFSGLKTAVLYHLRENRDYQPEIEAREAALARGERKFDQLLPLCSSKTLGLIREFQNAVVRELVERSLSSAEELGVRATFEERAKRSGLDVYFPSLALSTDNAAMIAAAAYPRLQNNILADGSLNASASLPIA